MASTGPGRLGPDFVKLWLAQGVSNLGDGVYVTALPLLAATLTRDPLPVSAVMFAEWLPWLLFGLLLAGAAVGGTLGSVVTPWLSRRLGPVAVMNGGSVLSGLVAFGVGLTRNPWVAGGLLALGGLCVVTFSVNLESLRQQLVPDRLLGRVISAFRLFSYGALPLGALVGGVLARSCGGAPSIERRGSEQPDGRLRSEAGVDTVDVWQRADVPLRRVRAGEGAGRPLLYTLKAALRAAGGRPPARQRHDGHRGTGLTSTSGDPAWVKGRPPCPARRRRR